MCTGVLGREKHELKQSENRDERSRGADFRLEIVLEIMLRDMPNENSKDNRQCNRKGDDVEPDDLRSDGLPARRGELLSCTRPDPMVDRRDHFLHRVQAIHSLLNKIAARSIVLKDALESEQRYEST